MPSLNTPTAPSLSRAIFFGDEFQAAFLSLVQQVAEFHGVAGARFERLAVVAENFSEADVNQLCIFRCIRFPASDDKK